MNAYPLSRWTMPVLRAGMGVFLAASVVLVLNARDSHPTLDERLGRVGPFRHG